MKFLYQLMSTKHLYIEIGMFHHTLAITIVHMIVTCILSNINLLQFFLFIARDVILFPHIWDLMPEMLLVLIEASLFEEFLISKFSSDSILF
jgi:hypothetical protein